MSRLRCHAKPLIAIAALAAIAVVLSACAFLKSGSLALSQPGAIGSARVHFVICTEPSSAGCNPTKEAEETQYLLGIAVPPGSVPPATITAIPVGGGSPLVFTRSDEVATEMAAASVGLQKLAEEEGEGGEVGVQVWPPAGLQGVGYLSNAQQEQVGALVEWNVDADFGLPAAADGSPFPGPFATGITFGLREVSPAQPASRPARCVRFEAGVEPQDGDAICSGTVLQGQIGTSDLTIGAPAKTSVFLGGKAKVSFPANFATTTTPSPSFALSATSTLPKAQLKVGNSTFTPGPPNPTTHRSPTAPQKVTVTVPKNAKPGTYNVTLTAKTPQGGSVSQVAKLKVAKAKLSLGGAQLNKAKGIATLSVKIPGAGTLTATGKDIVKVKKPAKQAKKPKTLKLTIKAKGKAKKELAEEGTAKVSAKITFKPLSGTPVTKTKKITLKRIS
ncbi:MAG TPA: hypothetical protein VIT89_06335 [Solirubrobacterales bacterium]